MLILQKVITQKLKEIPQISNQKQYFNIGIDKKSFPMVIVNFPSVNDMQNRQDINIEIDVWYENKASSIITAETIVDAIDNKFRKLNCILDNACISIDRQNICMLTIPDIDENILRKQLKYTAKVYLTN